ncbi:MAG: hypothetical protein JWM16_344 [Verrucomicrobiales bacterium]|nr:hypothetical protein [Verrucomicrobiales bacterium]
MTELLLKLLGANVENGVDIARASLAFRGGFSPGGYVFLVLAFAVAVYFMYRMSPAYLSPLRKYTLAALRTIFLALILMLLLRPVLAFTVEGSVRRLLVMLMDTSSSMQIKDPRIDSADQKRSAIAKGFLDPGKGINQNLDSGKIKEVDQVARIDLVKAAFKNEKLNLLPNLDREFEVDAFAFSQGLAPIGGRKEEGTNGPTRKKDQKVTVDQFPWVDNLSATNPSTAIGDAIREIMNRKRGQPLAGIVLVTDGANNHGSQPREVAGLMRQEGLPLYVYGVGITRPRDIIMGSVFAPEVSFVKDEVTVTVRVRSQGLNNENADLVLNMGGQKVAEKNITFTGDGEQAVTLHFIPPNPGEFDLQASIEPRPDETVKDNNYSMPQRLKVIDAKIKVLLVEQSPRWEFRYLQAMLLRDRRVDLQCLLMEGDIAITRGEKSPYIHQFPSRKEDLFKYDLIIFGDVDPKTVSVGQLENLNEFVSRFGGALVMVAGKKFSPAAYRRTVMEKMLPVEFEGGGLESSSDFVADKPVHLELTAAGRNSPMLRLSDKEEESAALWKDLPPVYWVAKVSRPKPAAEVLLVDKDPARESRFGKMPVIAVQKYGLGQVMFVGTDNTWRWRKNAGDLYYTTLWGQIAQRVSLQHLLGVSKKTQLSTDRQNYLTGDRISIYARLYADGFEPIQEPTVKGLFGLQNGQGAKSEVTLRPIPEQTGLYRAEFIAPSPGAYQFFVERDLNVPLEFNVAEPKFELGETAMNEGLLREMTQLTGGAFFREEDLRKLPETIHNKTERVRSPLEVELWASPLFYILMLLVVSSEWVLRKLSHLK